MSHFRVQNNPFTNEKNRSLHKCLSPDLMPRIIQLKWGGLHQCYPSVVHNSYWEGGLKNAGVGGERGASRDLLFCCLAPVLYSNPHPSDGSITRCNYVSF